VNAGRPSGRGSTPDRAGSPWGCLVAALPNINSHALVVICGLISEYNTEPHGTRELMQIRVKSAAIRGIY
jgi:NADPH-dependent curcumin reductase CurA